MFLYHYPSHFTLERAADGYLYVVEHDRVSGEPILLRTWWPTGLSAHSITRSYGEEVIGCRVNRDQHGRYHLHGRNTFITLEHGPATRGVLIERIPIPEPRQKGKKLPVQYQMGWWLRELKSGELVNTGFVEEPIPIGNGPGATEQGVG